MINPLVREPLKTFERLTNPSNERNIYTHPNPLARDIFWQRLELLLCGMKQNMSMPRRILDFGGGSGGFLKGLALSFPESIIDVIDLDPDDAERVCQYNHLSNVRVFRGNIDSWQPDDSYDVVVATDVLEHFPNLKMPVDAIQRFMTNDGFLCISVPTENLLYRAGRVILNKKKPLDHFHPGSTILRHLNENGFNVIWKSLAPKYCSLPLPLFQLAILRSEELNAASIKS